jgi:hypothetical protein
MAFSSQGSGAPSFGNSMQIGETQGNAQNGEELEEIQTTV